MKATLLVALLFLSFTSYAQVMEGERSGNTRDFDEMISSMVYPGYKYDSQSCYYLQAASPEMSSYVCEELYLTEYHANTNPNYLPLTPDQTKVMDLCCIGMYLNTHK